MFTIEGSNELSFIGQIDTIRSFPYYDEITGICAVRRSDPALNVYARKALNYKIPAKFIEFMNGIGNGIYKPHGIMLNAQSTPSSLIHPVMHRTVRCNNKTIHTLTDINIFDWVRILYEKSLCINNIFYINCNPDSTRYGNIMLLYEHEDLQHISIIYNKIDEFIKDLESWLNYNVEIPSNAVDIIDQYLDEIPIDADFRVHQELRSYTNRELLTGIFVEKPTYQLKDLREEIYHIIPHLLCQNIEQLSFSRWIISRM